MKKRTLIVAALLAAMTVGANAQENLALNKEATASSNENDNTAPGLAVDGDDEKTRWSYATSDKDDIANDDACYFQVDLTGEEDKTVAFNNVEIKWENDNVKRFKILTSNDAKTWTVVYEQTADTDNSGTKSYYFKAQNARYIRLKATQIVTYFSFYEFRVFNKSYTQVLTTLEAPTYVAAGSVFTLNIKDQNGVDIDAEIEPTNATRVEGSTNTFVAGESGEMNLKVTYNGEEKDVTVWAVPKLTEPTLKAGYSFFDNSSDALDMYGTEWEGGYGAWSVDEFADNKVLEATTVKTFGFQVKDAYKDNIETEYKSFNFDIYPTEDVTDGYINFQNAGKNVSLPTLKAGKWNRVSIDVTGVNQFTGYIKWKLRSESAPASTLNILLDNIYLSKDKAQLTEEVKVAKTATNGFYAVTGYAKSADIINDQLTDPTIAAYDLTNLELDEGTTYELNPTNPNALIYVKGEGNDNWKPSQDWGNTKNLVGYAGDATGYCVPSTNGVSYEDGYAIFTDRTLAAKANRPFSYQRTIKANTYVSTYLPVGTKIPAGCKAYALELSEDGSVINLVEATTLNAETPYFIHNESSADAVLEISSGDDVQMIAGKEHEKETTFGSIATVKGNYSYIVGDGSQYVLDGTSYNAAEGTLTLKKCTDKTKIVPFRVYFTGVTPSRVVKFMLPGTVTGINDVKANAQKAADVYSIDGRLVKKAATSVEGLASGVYIMNGKKYVVK